jgi:hypothetical protein
MMSLVTPNHMMNQQYKSMVLLLQRRRKEVEISVSDEDKLLVSG